jgi:hypothetical protein
MPPIANATDQATISAQFQVLAEEWKSATTLLSSTTALMAHPAYRAIIALGPPVVPLLLQDLQREPVHWFEALQVISGEDPVPREHWGDMAAMRLDWLNWGRQRGLL